MDEQANEAQDKELLPCPTGDPDAQAAAKTDPADIPRFGANSPFDSEYESPIPKKAKQLWARSILW